MNEQLFSKLKEIWENPKTGFSGSSVLLAHAKKVIPGVKLADVKKFLKQNSTSSLQAGAYSKS